MTHSHSAPDPSRLPEIATPRILAGQTAVVTGASSGIGKAIAQELAAAGAKVAVNYRSGEEAARDIVAAIQEAGGEALAVQADVSQEDHVIRLFQETQEAFGSIDILINNAGLQQDGAFHDMSLAQWQKVIDVNLTGQFLCAREAVRRFIAQGLRPEVSVAMGKIICISSVHQQIPWGGRVNYATSKGGVKLMMESLAQEVAPRRIRVNSIAPGAVRTPINTEAWETPAAYQTLMKKVPYGRIGEPEDIARAALWLASDAADYVVGTTLYVDGGTTLYPAFANDGEG